MWFVEDVIDVDFGFDVLMIFLFLFFFFSLIFGSCCSAAAMSDA